ncbi:MAG TPA: MFS transporter [Kofleriaceae bacterium]|nr:MFS transporter [Kofleriaceae bacterium]
MTSPTAGVRLGEASGRWVILAAVLGSGMAMLDATVVNVALPALGHDLGAGLDGLQWTLNGYTLTLASFILLGGSLGDRFGRRRVFVIGTVWFAAASLLCGAAPTIELLVAARALQGVGGALLTPGSLAMIAGLFRGEERGRAIGLWSGFGGLAGAVGPFVGGWLIGSVGWRWIFLVNLPLAVAVVLVAQRHVPETADPDASKSLDGGGAALGAIGLGGLTYALVRAGEDGLAPAVIASGAIGIAALLGFVLFERRTRHPMLPLGLFASRQFAAANAVTFLVYGALGGIFFLFVVQLQVVGGFSPVLAGASLLPITAMMLLLSGTAGALAERIGPRLPMAAGPALSACGVALMLRIGARPSFLADVLPAVTVFGLGLAISVAPLTATVLGAADARFAGIASGVNNAVARAAGLLAVAVLPLAAGLHGDAYRRPDAFAGGFRLAALICCALLASAGLLAAIAIRNRATGGVAAAPEATSASGGPSRLHCPVAGPALHLPPETPARAGS